MKKQRNLTTTLVPALLLMALAVMVRFVLAERFEILPADYFRTLEYTAEAQIRERIDEPMSASVVSVRQVAQTLTVNGSVAIIQNNLYWYTDAGDLIFQSSGLYGVDRSTRINLPGYGDISRSGQYLFPPGIKQEPFIYWDAMFIGPRQAEFVGVQVLDGLKLYKFHFSAVDMDETIGYSGLPDVPERFHVNTDGEGTLWIEPISGILVNYEESGVSYYVDVVSNKNVADLFIWKDTFTPETHASQLSLAQRGRLRILAFKFWLPVLLLTAGLVWLLVGLLIGSRITQSNASF